MSQQLKWLQLRLRPKAAMTAAPVCQHVQQHQQQQQAQWQAAPPPCAHHSVQRSRSLPRPHKDDGLAQLLTLQGMFVLVKVP